TARGGAWPYAVRVATIRAVTESKFQVVRIAGFATALTLALVLQRVRPHARLSRRPWVNLALWVIDGAVMSTICGACTCTVARWAGTGCLGLLNNVPAPSWMALLSSVWALDFVSYAWHRANHRIPLLWRFHQVHHSDVDFTVSTGLRFHPGELLL